MKLAQTPCYEYLPKQEQFMHNCDIVPYSGYIGGFGSGKTHVLNLQALRWACVSGTDGLIGAPTYKMLEDTTQAKFFELCPPQWIRSFQRSRNKATLINGTTILFRSLDRPDRLAGLELDWWALDEVGDVKEDTFRMLQGRLRARKLRRGCGVGNPAGPVHWTYEHFVELAEQYPDVYRLVQAPTYENTYLPEGYTRDMEISFGIGTVYYRRYVLGEFAAFEGAYWVNFDSRLYPEGHVLQPEEALAPLTNGPIKFGRGIDFGFEHPFVHLWYATDGTSLVIFDEYCQSHGLISWHLQNIRQRDIQHQSLYGPHTYDVAYTDHDAVCRAEIAAGKDENGKPLGFTCIPTEKKVMESILLVQALFGLHRLFITKNCRQTLKEIPSYRAKDGVVGEQPLKEKDDTCDCIRYISWMELNHTAPYKRFPTTYTVPDNIMDHQSMNFEEVI